MQTFVIVAAATALLPTRVPGVHVGTGEAVQVAVSDELAAAFIDGQADVTDLLAAADRVQVLVPDGPATSAQQGTLYYLAGR